MLITALRDIKGGINSKERRECMVRKSIENPVKRR